MNKTLRPWAQLFLWGSLGLWLAPHTWAAAPKITQTGEVLQVTSPFQVVQWSLKQPSFVAITLDSLGNGQMRANALRAPARTAQAYEAIPAGSAGIEYRRASTLRKIPAGWRFEATDRQLRLLTQWSPEEKPDPLVLEFDPSRCHVTLLGKQDENAMIRLPAVLHFPSQGSYRITVAEGNVDIPVKYDARRSQGGYVRLTFPAATAAQPVIDYRWEIAAIYPSLGKLDKDPRFDGFRKNWLNIFQFNPRLGVLANHAGSDACAFCLYEYADLARYTPPLAEGLSALDLVRQSLDRYLDGFAGYGMPGWVSFDGSHNQPSADPPFLDTYPSLLIAAADYVSGSQDGMWLEKRYSGLKAWADALLAMDRDGNGLFEYPRSGNTNSWAGNVSQRPANWWDTIGFGHEDAYGNALAYRALRGMEMLAQHAGNELDAQRYQAAAAKLRRAYFPTFYNPASGVLAGWKSADGQLHDYHFLFVNGAAIHYGLVPKDNALAILDQLRAKMSQVGYKRFDLGLPGNLVPVARRDYVHREKRWGGGEKEDNSDAFQIYENGGATASFAYFTLAAQYDLNQGAEADRMLLPLLDAFAKGQFEGQGANGMSNDWKAWDGTPWGYEGFLVDNYYALLAVLTRERMDRTGIAYTAK